MKLKPVSLAVAAVAAGLTLSSAQAGVVKTEGEDIIVSTKNGGLQLKTEDGAFSFKVSGKLQWDYANLDEFVAGGKDKDFGYLRRGKLGISGKAYSDWKYKLVLESDDNDIVLDEANITYGGFKPANIKIGRWGNEFGLEDSVSSSWIMAIERPHIYEALRADGNNDYGVQVLQPTRITCFVLAWNTLVWIRALTAKKNSSLLTRCVRPMHPSWKMRGCCTWVSLTTIPTLIKKPMPPRAPSSLPRREPRSNCSTVLA